MSVPVSIWKPVGKEPSGLWPGEINDFNDVFSGLVKHFETHESYCYAFQSWNPADSLLYSHGSLKLSRIAKWLDYHGFLKHHTEKFNDATGNPKDPKGTLHHILTPLLRMRLAYENGAFLKIGRSYSEAQIVGVGKPYPSYAETKQWLESNYDQSKVAKWRRSKWWSDFNNLFNQNIAKPKEEMQKVMVSWLYQRLTSIPKRGRSAIAKERACLTALNQTSLFDQTSPRTKPLTDFCEG